MLYLYLFVYVWFGFTDWVTYQNKAKMEDGLGLVCLELSSGLVSTGFSLKHIGGTGSIDTPSKTGSLKGTSFYLYLFVHANKISLYKHISSKVSKIPFGFRKWTLENGLIYFVDLMPFTALYSSNVRHKYISISQVLYNLSGFLEKGLQILLSLTTLNIRYDVKNKPTSTSLIESVRWLRKWLQHYTKLITFSTFYSRCNENNKYTSRSSIIFVWLLRKWAPIFCWGLNF